MNPMSPPQIMASILAGLIIFAIHALAGLAVNFSLLITLFFSILTPLPLALISFRLGTAASLLTLFTATAAMMATSTPLYAVTYNIFFLLPSFCGCWLLGLLETSNTENSCNEETNNWFPLNSTLSLLGAFVSFLSFLLVVFLHKHPTFQEITHVISTQVTENIKVLQQQNIVDATKADKMIPELTQNIIPLLFSWFALYGLIIGLLNLYISSKISWKNAWTARPEDNWAQAFQMPMASLITLASFIILPMLSESFFIKMSSFIVISCFSFLFLLSGLAAVHRMTRAFSGRIFILTIFYFLLLGTILIIPLSILLFLIGVWTTLSKNKAYFKLKSERN